MAEFIEDAGTDSDLPILDSYFDQGENRVVTAIMNFSIEELKVVWDIVEQDVLKAWNVGRSRRSSTCPKVALVILKHYDMWDKDAVDFGFETNTLEKMLYKILEAIESVLFSYFVEPVAMAYQRADGKVIAN